MKGAKVQASRLVTMLAALCLALCMAVMALPATAHADDDAVRADRNGVLKFNWSIDNTAYAAGSCFLVNDQYVVTAYHCVMPSTRTLQEAGFTGADAAELRKHLTYSVIINRDMKVEFKSVPVDVKQVDNHAENYVKEKDFFELFLSVFYNKAS